MKQTYQVTLDLPDGVSKKEMAAYIEEAICSWKGGIDPEDLISDLDISSVKVRQI